MFNGIIEDLGEIITVKEGSQIPDSKGVSVGREFVVKTSWDEPPDIGDSIAINGVCTTVTDYHRKKFRVFTSEQTLSITNLSQLKVGDKINLERSLIYGSRINGHIVYGHVDKTLNVSDIEKYESSWLFTFTLDPDDLASVILKGSIAINGISLTIYDLGEGHLSVMIIPHTFRHTNLSTLKIGDQVNCEFDSLGKFLKKYVETYLQN